MNEKAANLTLKSNLTLNKSASGGNANTNAFVPKPDAYMNVVRPEKAKAREKAGNMDMAALVGYLSNMKK
jgi:hypothetical protein